MGNYCNKWNFHWNFDLYQNTGWKYFQAWINDWTKERNVDGLNHKLSRTGLFVTQTCHSNERRERKEREESEREEEREREIFVTRKNTEWWKQIDRYSTIVVSNLSKKWNRKLKEKERERERSRGWSGEQVELMEGEVEETRGMETRKR